MRIKTRAIDQYTGTDILKYRISENIIHTNEWVGKIIYTSIFIYIVASCNEHCGMYSMILTGKIFFFYASKVTTLLIDFFSFFSLFTITRDIWLLSELIFSIYTFDVERKIMQYFFWG